MARYVTTPHLPSECMGCDQVTLDGLSYPEGRLCRSCYSRLYQMSGRRSYKIRSMAIAERDQRVKGNVARMLRLF